MASMYWCFIESDYIEYLKTFEKRIPNIDYGSEHMKPFFAPLFEKDGLVYVTQVTSPKPRHESMKNQIDFIKYYSPKGKLLGAVNLNYMFPVPKESIIPISYANITDYKTFKTEEDKSQYVHFLKMQIKILNDLRIDESAVLLYTYCQNKPYDNVTRRCFRFAMLEQKAHAFPKTEPIK